MGLQKWDKERLMKEKGYIELLSKCEDKLQTTYLKSNPH